MKNFFVLTAFMITLVFGLMLSAANPFFFPNKNLSSARPRPIAETKGKPLFTLKEVNNLMHKQVTSKNAEFKFGENGRIVSFQMLGGDQFLIEIYWGNGVKDDNSTITFHDKDRFYKDFDIIN